MNSLTDFKMLIIKALSYLNTLFEEQSEHFNKEEIL